MNDIVGVRFLGRAICAGAGVMIGQTGPAQALIAAIIGPMPRMLITRVRL